ncbi:MAG: protein-L-isoaspartate(D-aspartate) O-methyltransferase [Gammaproteobacteria bacterium]|nr:protein-L-isoaspartate(D-aspartate) O-methyltransferase [Gammaproteobacteria bacterium]MDH4314370.1 protein-L-isoaspartate(D-aspartate) O-methyltransferase [Gammaproteobacteria bacterium]MDH5214208.1 protein-L-isoaspartate(D-aspartate) O-methyltransferase [Gammaproteobacteria bacterium]MDH5499510.1 protein-L-isoaspartate(D-aspartate) O-methyltransferase [Gammaproteobacteria bacterium]
MPRFSGVLLLIASGLGLNSACGQMNYESERQAMVDELRNESRLTEEYGAPRISDQTLEVLGRVPRHEFVPDDQKRYAYENRPLPIGAGQTISQPYIVALMTDLAEVTKDDVVLEVGTGSGYQAAVLSELAGHVYTIEIIEMLGQRAKSVLDRLGYNNVTVRIGDGYAGWPDQAPFDAILVTAAPENIPQPLIEQLAVGGRMVIPVGAEGEVQVLQVLTKNSDGLLIVKNVIAVRFVPLIREER